jgi:hypothetical protein
MVRKYLSQAAARADVRSIVGLAFPALRAGAQIIPSQ